MKDKQIAEVLGSIENRIRHIYNCGYQQGYEDGKKQQDMLWAGERYRQELTAKGYYRGLEDAWETAKQIVSKSSAKMSDIFGEVYAESVFEKFTADQAMKKIMDYESTINYHDDFATALEKMHKYEEKPHSLLDAYFQMRKERE